MEFIHKFLTRTLLSSATNVLYWEIIKKNYNPIMGCKETTLFSPDLEKVLMNYCDLDDCLEILSERDFLSEWAAMPTPTCSS